MNGRNQANFGLSMVVSLRYMSLEERCWPRDIHLFLNKPKGLIQSLCVGDESDGQIPEPLVKVGGLLEQRPKCVNMDFRRARRFS